MKNTVRNVIVRALSNQFKGGTVVMATFPHGNKEYAFILPKEVKANVGDRVSAKVKRGHFVPVTIRQILPMTKKNLNIAGTDLCEIYGPY